MDVDTPLALLAGQTPRQFMKRHWQKKPLLVRQAFTELASLPERGELFELASREGVESRLVQRLAKGWQLRHGPFARRSLPALKARQWSLLVQGVDLHHAGVQQLLSRFRFVPEARLDDVMISYASDGGGVGPHLDSYDVFLLQSMGRRRWRIGRQKDASMLEGAPLKLLANFVPEQEFLLEPGDMLYLPPGYGHDGVAEGQCMTCSIGFRAPGQAELASELLSRIADEAGEHLGALRYSDPWQRAASAPGAIPEPLLAFARKAVRMSLQEPKLLERLLGEYLSEPKANVWFAPAHAPMPQSQLTLDAATRMMYDAKHVFINGESYRAAGRDAILMRRLADKRQLALVEWARASVAARSLLMSWHEAGWLHGQG